MPNKKMCGLYGAHVKKSKFNDDCPCIDCMGTHCHECPTFDMYACQIGEADERTKCFLCKTFGTNNR